MKRATNNIEREIVARILEGDEAALTLFYKENKARLFSFILQRVGRREDGEELLQDTYLAAIESLRDFTFKSSLSTFLLAIARNKIFDFYRKRRLKTIVFSKFPELSDFISELLEPEEAYEVKEARRRFYEALRVLRPRYRKILRLKYIEGLTVFEIAKKLSESFKAIESELFRARKEFVRVFSKWEEEKILMKRFLRG